MDRVFKGSEFRKLVESNEFSPVLGKGVESGNKKINGEAYKEIENDTKKVYKNLGKNATGSKTERHDDNKGMSDLQYDLISKPFKEKIASQMKGYTSADAEKKHKNDEFGNADFGTDKQVKDAEKKAKDFKKGKDTAKEIGLTSSHLDKNKIEKNTETMAESKKIKKFNFHRTFINENHMLSLVPDHMKNENNRFMMSDKKGTEYIVEWHAHEPLIVKKNKKNLMNEEFARMKQLANYKSKEYFNTTSAQERLAEDTSFKNMVDRARELMG